MNLLLRQIGVLVRKNLWLILSRKSRTSTVYRAFIAPFIVAVYLCFIFRIYFPNAVYGIGSPQDVRNLTDAMQQVAGKRDTLILVNQGPRGGDIDRVIGLVAGPPRAAGRNVTIAYDDNSLRATCRSNLQGVTKCYSAAVFYSSPSEGGIWNYTLRGDASLGLFSVDVTKNTNDAEMYILPLQHAIDTAIATINSSRTSVLMPAKVQEYPFTGQTEQQWKDTVTAQLVKDNTNFAAVVWYLGFIGLTYHLVGLMAKERETEMSDLVESMMPNIRRWEPQLARLVSNHLAFDIVYGPSWIVMGIIARIGLFQKSSGGIIVIGFILAGLALTSFSILGASFFKKAQLSGITVTMVVIVLGIITQICSKWMSTGVVAVLGFLFTPMAFINFLIGCTRWELQNQPINLVHAPPNSPWALPGIVFWVFFIFQIFCYPLLAAFFERSLYGTAAHRTGRKVIHTSDADLAPVRLTNFTKVYRPNPITRFFSRLFGAENEIVAAASNVTLSVPQGEIMVLVGANGCGKSTTLNAIAGLIDITSGSIEVDGTGGIGLCPQKNVLWNSLSVKQHARIFNGLKRSTTAVANEDIDSLIDTCGLKDKIDTPSRSLSGGQKRKLQLVMMLTGGSRVCCVDEVSGGLDPLSRRRIWSILLAERGTRTVLLTTHFLDEAEFLADHMVLMHKGELKAEGSVSELKQKLGGGYRVHTLPSTTEEKEATETTHEEVQILPDPAAAIKAIQVLEREGKTHYQVTGPTIEEVFMNLATADAEPSDHYSLTDAGSQVSASPDQGDGKERVSASVRDVQAGIALTKYQPVGPLRQTLILFLKRWKVLSRNPAATLSALLIPVVAAGFVSLLLKGTTNPGCALIDQVHISDNQNLSRSINPLIVIGPSSTLSPASLQLVFKGLPNTTSQVLGSSNGSFLHDIHLVNTIQEFNDYTRQYQANVTPGGIWTGDASSSATFDYRADIAISGGNTGIVGMYNSILMQNLLNVIMTNTSISTSYAVFDFPFPGNTGDAIQFAFYFGLVMALYPAFFALYPTRERLSNVRALEYSNGVRPFPLWLAYMSFDFVTVVLVSALITIIFAATSLGAWYHVGYMFLILLLYGIASTLLSYVLSLFAKSQLSAFAFSAGGQALMVVLYLTAYMTIEARADPGNVTSEQTLVHFTLGLITPVGQLVRAFLLGLNLFSILCKGSPPVKASFPGAISVYGGPILYLIGQSFFLFGFLVWSDHRFSLGRLRRSHSNTTQRDAENTTSKEPEVMDEIERVATSHDGLKVLHIEKTFKSWAYGNVTAVEDITFGVKQGEVFALVGPNGAGKSTTISMLRGEIQPSRSGGQLFIQDISVLQNRQLARSHIGVCPQFDAMDQLNVREHLRFYAGMRGVTGITPKVETLIKAVGLLPFADRMAEKLSGGNKRKLSLAIALIGNPQVVLLDEPSSGMDPLSKRSMWKTLEKFRPGRSILLTTHSMEEADALASRVGVIAKSLLDIGTTQHLRNKHGHGFHIHLVLKGSPLVDEDTMENAKTWIQHQILGAELEGKPYHGQMRFNIPSKITSSPDEKDEILVGLARNKKERSIAELFLLLEENKEKLGIEFYSISPSTFDEVFLKIVEKHHIGEEELPERAKKWYRFLTGRH